jgi:tetratricopeptide (TPR) repeat protein
VLREDPSHREALVGMARILITQERAAEAVPLLSAALALDSTHADARHLFAIALHATGRTEEAAAQFQAALAHETRDPGFLAAAGDALRAQESRAMLCRSASAHALAIALQPEATGSQVSLVAVLQGLQMWESSQQWLAQPWAEVNLPSIHFLKGLQRYSGLRLELDEAAEMHLTAAMEGFPPDHVVRINLAFLLLSLGRYAEGFARYEDRLTIRWDGGPLLSLQQLMTELGPQTLWQGESLEGADILLVDEQGFGDTLMAMRLVPILRDRYRPARIRFLCEKPIGRLAQATGFFDEIIPRSPDAELERGVKFCPLMSLPHRLGLTLENLSDKPYLTAVATDVNSWRARLSELPGLKVGIAWCGNAKTGTDVIRSLPLDALALLFDVPGIQWLSLQKGVRLQEADAEALGMLQWMDECTDFLASAGLFAALDLIITVDTATVHLAGALGCETWLLNRYDTEWRWGMEGERAPWYSSVRQLRQTRRGDWSPVIETMAAALQAWALTRSPARPTP